MDLDRQYLEYNYIRYYDNIYIFINNKDDGLTLINDISKCLKDKYKLEINQNKTSITHYLSKRMLGYYFVKEDNIVKAKKNKQLNIIAGINQLSKKKITNIILSMMVFLPKKIIQSYLKTKIKK